MPPDTFPPKMCFSCARRADCAELCEALAQWCNDMYRDHYSVDTPEEYRWPVEVESMVI